MEMEPVIWFGDDAEKGDPGDLVLDVAPVSAAHYLRQVRAERANDATVVTAGADYSMYEAMQTVKVDDFNRSVPETSISLIPPEAWQRRQVADFSNVRSRLVRLRAKLQKAGKLPTYLFPSLESERGWDAFCFLKCTTQVKREMEANKSFPPLSSHKGTPPLLKVVLAMSQPEANDAFGFHAEWFIEKGYSTERAHWLYSLMCVLEKPLEADTIACMRDLARFCTEERAKLQSSEDPVVRSHSWVIAIVARYFNQRDLGD